MRMQGLFDCPTVLEYFLPFFFSSFFFSLHLGLGSVCRQNFKLAGLRPVHSRAHQGMLFLSVRCIFFFPPVPFWIFLSLSFPGLTRVCLLPEVLERRSLRLRGLDSVSYLPLLAALSFQAVFVSCLSAYLGNFCGKPDTIYCIMGTEIIRSLMRSFMSIWPEAGCV